MCSIIAVLCSFALNRCYRGPASETGWIAPSMMGPDQRTFHQQPGGGGQDYDPWQGQPILAQSANGQAVSVHVSSQPTVVQGTVVQLDRKP